MHLRKVALLVIAFCCLSCIAPSAPAQTTSVPLFGPVDVRPSQSNATYQTPLTFNTNTLTLNCTATGPITATLSGTPDGSGPVLVDNNIFVSSTKVASPENVCQGGQTDNSSYGSFPDCFTSAYQNPAGKGQLNTLDVDSAPYPGSTSLASIVSTGGVPPIDISAYLSPNATQTLTVALEDQGGYVASSSVYLITSCSVTGVQNGGTISGNPITGNSNNSSNQDFTFNPITKQQIGFSYDVSGAYTAQSLSGNKSDSIPQVSDSGLSTANFTNYAKGTSFATSTCFVHTGELLDGQPSCKLFTLTCTNSQTSTNAGANCPVSSKPNEVLQDVFDGPPFKLTDITTPNGTFHQGIGFLMASEGWTGGACTFDQDETDLASELCPRNLLTSFTGPGSFTSGGTTTHPNSTFISVYGVPEDLTTISVTNASGAPAPLGPGNWTNQPNTYVVLSSQPPSLSNTGFVAAPIQSITYGISPSTPVPVPGSTAATDTVVTNPAGCPSPSNPASPAAKVFATSPQSLSLPGDGTYLLHYYAQDCAGTEELRFAQDAGSWTTNFYTYPINIDTGTPDASSITLSAPSPYYQDQIVTATYSCSDPPLSPTQPGSGVVTCGNQTYSSGVASTGNLTSPVNTSAAGTQSFTVNVADAAGNTSSAAATYSVNIDSQIQFTLSSNSIVYPLGTELHVQVQNINGSVPTGTVIILDNGNSAATLTLKKGSVYFYLANLPAGKHSLNAEYLGDGSNPFGYSAAVQLAVQPVPVTLTASCWNTPYPYGANYQCGVYASSNAGAPQGNITYTYDGGAPVSLPLVSGSAQIILTKPPVGNHSLVISYPAQTNYAAAGPINEPFTVTPAPVNVQVTPSAWYLTGGNVTLTAAVTSWSAGAPSNNGVVTFTSGNTILGGSSVPVNATGVAAIIIPATALPNGSDAVTATYSSGANYASGSTTITLDVAVPAAP